MLSPHSSMLRKYVAWLDNLVCMCVFLCVCVWDGEREWFSTKEETPLSSKRVWSVKSVSTVKQCNLVRRLKLSTPSAWELELHSHAIVYLRSKCAEEFTASLNIYIGLWAERMWIQKKTSTPKKEFAASFIKSIAVKQRSAKTCFTCMQFVSICKTET